jgi:hypothetical protein
MLQMNTDSVSVTVATINVMTTGSVEFPGKH